MIRKKKNIFHLFLIQEGLHIIFFLILIWMLMLFTYFYTWNSFSEVISILSVPITGLFAYFIFILQLYYNYRNHRLRKNSLIISMLTELDHNTQLLIDIRKNFVNSVAPIFINRIKEDKKVPQKEKIEIETILKNVRLDKIKEPCDFVGQTINNLENIYTKESSKEDMERKIDYFTKHMPVFRVTFDFEDRLTYGLLKGIKVQTKADEELIKILSRYTWLSNIMRYNFNLISNWHDYKNHCDKAWYLNAIIARHQYSKNTLQIIKEVLNILDKDPEVFIELKKNKLGHLYKLYYGEV